MRPELDATIRPAVHQLLRIRIGNNEINALKIGGDHVVHGIRSATTNTDHGNTGREIRMVHLGYCQVQGHSGLSPVLWTGSMKVE
jgi:hypothetical protein